jgi:hypothetical protein
MKSIKLCLYIIKNSKSNKEIWIAKFLLNKLLKLKIKSK